MRTWGRVTSSTRAKFMSRVSQLGKIKKLRFRRADSPYRIIKFHDKRSKTIPFSAFWLRSSVVYVLISLISDTRVIDPHDINHISFTGASPME
ncbi:hypothetical protein MPTK1_4g17340 [Marchantia polymorpha subsp. ruderalis]|uniref:Uncharacterized protein n=2 Tax=Marchantia polymorpha TaxID=3197 RepID=A0AAF6BAU2_MARPO|nr:hypothetical protein MARPO_0041s0016 [Marchantia polymorpha]BBN09126.1 hypothetical protein Mp_4g17340 [Marchantia polymorpha subsp. ruderalis]|eukprot:PTQ40114.1 hypothetical protein MARPO_0041s0016 [Marchantia polymorpha]